MESVRGRGRAGSILGGGVSQREVLGHRAKPKAREGWVGQGPWMAWPLQAGLWEEQR